MIATLALLAASGQPADIAVDLTREIATVPDGLYGAGYDGWGDITEPEAVERLQGLPIRFIRIGVDPALVCGEGPGEYDLQYAAPRDVGVGFLDRLGLIRSHGWEPLLALENSHSLPRFFHGEPRANNGKPWFRYDLDGTFHADAFGDQVDAWSTITRDVTAALAEAGLNGLHWETTYELGHAMPLPEIHYWAARGIKEADPTAQCIGPATWPGWTVEERFVRPYLARYDSALLDYVSVHWYANNEHGLWDTGYDPANGAITMVDDLWLRCLMEVTPKFGPWCESLRALLDSPELNPTGKRIGIAVTEMDANAFSPWMKSPANPKYPEYDPAADCYVNTNVFGGVWMASALCHLAKSPCDIAMKFNTRQYYGIVDHSPDDDSYMRVPVWYALRMLSDVAGLSDGARICAASVDGALDEASAHVAGIDTPWVECTAIGDADGFALVIVNRGMGSERAEVTVAGGHGSDYAITRYRFDASGCQRFIGRSTDQQRDGRFEPESACTCLEPLSSESQPTRDGQLAVIVACPPISMTVLVAKPL